MILYLLLSSAARMASMKVRPVHWMIWSLTYILGLPLLGLPPCLPPIMPSIRSRCRESCLMRCPKHYSFILRMVSNNDLLVPANHITSSFVAHLVQLIISIRVSVHISKASRHCCDILLIVYVSTPYSRFDLTLHLMNPIREVINSLEFICTVLICVKDFFAISILLQISSSHLQFCVINSPS